MPVDSWFRYAGKWPRIDRDVRYRPLPQRSVEWRVSATGSARPLAGARLVQEAELQAAGSPMQVETLLQLLANRLPISVFLITTQKISATTTTIKVYSTKP